MRSLHHIFKLNPLYVPGFPMAALSGHEWIVNTALDRADAISLTKHFEGREAPDKALDKAPGPPFNWQMELIGPTGLKWARALTFQRAEPSGAETPGPLEPAAACRGWELSPLTATSSTLLCLPEIKTAHRKRQRRDPVKLVSFITISIYPISPSETVASEAIFLNKW